MSAPAEIREAAEAGAGRRVFRGLGVPESMRAAYVRRADTGMFEGLAHAQKDPRLSIHVGEVPTPPLGPGEALVAVMAAALNYNNVWSALFEPVPGFQYLDMYALRSAAAKRHALDYHILGSDAAGVVLETGAGPSRYQPGDEVIVAPTYLESRATSIVDDPLTDPGMKAWGFETNFGAFAEVALVKTEQLLPKPRHLTWEEAASMQLVSATGYRMLVGDHGAAMRQGEVVLVWGATGGLGSLAAQYVRNGGGIPVCVVSSRAKAELLREDGHEAVIDRAGEGFEFWDSERRLRMEQCSRFRSRIRRLAGDDADVVFEHVGRDTFPVSVIVPKKGARIVTCASTSGYEHVYDNRYLWMNVRRIIGSHGATYEENWAANRLATRAMLHPTLSQTFRLETVGEATRLQQQNRHLGKLGVLCLAQKEGGGVRDPELRERHIDSIRRYGRAWSRMQESACS